ncbi:MAG: RNA polymerase sigma factor [Planctomycetota bacterium]|jgi:RNA polymerase sigma-70 factor (ECF subfamily)
MGEGEPMRGAERLLAWVMDHHAAALEMFARQWCDCPADVLQDALLKLSQQRPVPDPLMPWLYTLVRNRAISVSRAARRRCRREREAVGQGEGWFVPSHAERLDAQAATEALRRLPAMQREVIVARIWGGLTFEEIADVTGTSASTAHRRYRAGLAGLRKRLAEPCGKSSENR